MSGSTPPHAESIRPVLSLPGVDGWDEGGGGRRPLSVAVSAHSNTGVMFAACRASKEKEGRMCSRQR